jgi:hypothetical protein
LSGIGPIEALASGTIVKVRIEAAIKAMMLTMLDLITFPSLL